MPTSLRSRLLGSYLLITTTVLVLVAVGFFLLLSSNPIATRLIYERLEAISTLTLRAERVQGQGQARALRAAIQQLGARTDAQGVIVDRQGNIRATGLSDDTVIDSEGLSNLQALEEIERGVFESADGRSWLYLARPMGNVAVLVVFAPVPTVRLIPFLAAELLPPLAGAAALALAGSLLLALAISRWVAAPLRRISSAAETVIAGRYPQEISVNGPAEVRALGDAFNRMLIKVRASETAMKAFVANVSHELKTPLTSIQGFAQAILDGTASDPAQQARAAQVIQDEALRLRRMAEGLLDLARLDAGQAGLDMRSVDLKELLLSVKGRLLPSASEREVEVVLQADGAGTVVGDHDRLGQVFINLIDNAIRHSPEGGLVRVTVEADPTRVRIHVDDTGRGLTPHQAERIFDRFYRVDEARAEVPGNQQGAGLGLAISDEIVRAHGGRIAVLSEEDRGSRFTVHLPRSRPDDSTISRTRG